ncbi:MerR family DNA-binding transcriptional regulator [Herbaspirillum lusitanum]|uniref:MerR family DNA-binding transcriptional regulator n=1 Tax=Herbaspirillum lusitanum TaxID=213312 RepID=A0ABW9A5X4_9BURK
MPTYTITELAQEFDITPRAIRFYEDQGLLSPRREGSGGRNRVYAGSERTRLKLTLRGKRLGFTLSEIKSLVDMYASPKDSAAQLQRFLKVLHEHREKLERQREDLDLTLSEIAAHEAECLQLLQQGGPGKPEKRTSRRAATSHSVTPTTRSTGRKSAA